MIKLVFLKMKVRIPNNLQTIVFDHEKENTESSVKKAAWRMIKQQWKPAGALKETIKNNIFVIILSDVICTVTVPDQTPVRSSLADILSRLGTVIADNVAIKADNQQLLGRILTQWPNGLLWKVLLPQ
jgi:hypothetical protein